MTHLYDKDRLDALCGTAAPEDYVTGPAGFLKTDCPRCLKLAEEQPTPEGAD